MTVGDTMTIQSKVLVFDSDMREVKRLKTLFDETSLIGLRAEQESSIYQVLRSNIDLGAVFIDDSVTLDTLRLIRETRTELPIFRRCTSEVDRPEALVGVIDYAAGDDALKESIESKIFTREYPLSITSTIADETRQALSGVF